MLTTILTFIGIAIAGSAVLFFISGRFGRYSYACSDQYGNQHSGSLANYFNASIVDCLDTAILSAVLFYRLLSITLIQAGAFGTLAGAAAGIIMLVMLFALPHSGNEDAEDTSQLLVHILLSFVNGCLLAAVIHSIGLF